MLGLYLHIPFCQAICSYCNFNRGLLDADLKTRYVSALEREIRAADPARVDRGADTIFFGGGTPSLLDAAEVARLIAACRETFDLTADAEITLETNPETASRERLDAFRAAGVNRISFGVQSFDDAELARLGRIHSAARARDAVRTARAAGFNNLSFDLMLWLPGQTLASWQRTVDEAIALAPDHLSLYLLELYPNAPLKESMARAQPGWAQVTDDDAADMYLAALDRLDAAGFAQYEISNVARPGYLSRHNLKYWQAGSWYGFGCGAHSTVDGVRWKNLASTHEYIDRLSQGAPVLLDRQDLSVPERMSETLFTGLRLTTGIDRRNFLARFGVDPWTRYRETLTPFVDEGLMWADDAAFGLTRRGMLVANDLLVTFV
ncbi:MAG TPA: radical SAM family heme chaperone HemW [Vicinamibacterales bacterium]|nr:radical SAM family heme chaperone HemW [Vicinamibacterales bacterium]